MRFILQKILTGLNYLMWIFPINYKRIVFISYYGKYYNDNPKAISDKLIDSEFELIWIVDEPSKFNEKGITFIKHHSVKYLYYIVTARVWIDNCRKPNWLRKRKRQLYIQTWHGGTWFKLAERDASEKLSEYYIRASIHDSKMTNAVVSCSKWNTAIIKKSFWYDGYILESGSPRSDIFFEDNYHSALRAREYFKLEKEEHIILYAPTFRNSEHISCYDLNYHEVIRYVSQKWPGKWKIVVRLHSNIAHESSLIKYNNDVLNGTGYPDINDIIMLCDLFLTDYSSGMFDAMLAKKKVILYMNDYEDFIKERGGFYFKFDELPFPIAKSNEEVNDIILSFNEENYIHKVNRFMNKIGYFDDGHASERVALYIKKKIDQ